MQVLCIFSNHTTHVFPHFTSVFSHFCISSPLMSTFLSFLSPGCPRRDICIIVFFRYLLPFLSIISFFISFRYIFHFFPVIPSTFSLPVFPSLVAFPSFTLCSFAIIFMSYHPLFVVSCFPYLSVYILSFLIRSTSFYFILIDANLLSSLRPS